MPSMNREPDKPVIGIVGGIGAGKSTVAAEFETLGCRRIDADALGHALLDVRGVREALRERWGDRVLGADGRVDRRAVADIVFDAPDELAALNAVMHPRMRTELERGISEALGDPASRGVALDAAVLFEAGWNDLCTHILFVDAPSETRARRVAGRGWTEAEMARREKSQISLDKKRRMCDILIRNSSSPSHLHQQVREAFHRMRHTKD